MQKERGKRDRRTKRKRGGTDWKINCYVHVTTHEENNHYVLIEYELKYGLKLELNKENILQNYKTYNLKTNHSFSGSWWDTCC